MNHRPRPVTSQEKIEQITLGGIIKSVKTIRAIQRAFEVLAALQRQPEGATLIELQTATQLSGPTLLRILKTLISLNAVRRSSTSQRYRNSIQLQALASAMSPVERFADVAAPWMDELCRRVEWPSDLIIHRGDDDYMSVLESSLRQSRFYVQRSRGRVRVNLLGSAAGTAFISALGQDRRRQLADACRAGRDLHNIKVIAAGDLDRRISEARRRGYASRHPAYRGGGYNGVDRDDSLQAIAVPLIAGTMVLGALNINWNRAAMTEREMVRRHLADLQHAAQGICVTAQSVGLLAELPDLESAGPEA